MFFICMASVVVAVIVAVNVRLGPATKKNLLGSGKSLRRSILDPADLA